MSSHFSEDEKRNFMLKKQIKDHLFEYILDIIGRMVLTMLLLYLCKAEDYIYGIVFSLAYSLGKILYNISYYRKERIDTDIKHSEKCNWKED